jgi:hypothetical protein
MLRDAPHPQRPHRAPQSSRSAHRVGLQGAQPVISSRARASLSVAGAGKWESGRSLAAERRGEGVRIAAGRGWKGVVCLIGWHSAHGASLVWLT